MTGAVSSVTIGEKYSIDAFGNLTSQIGESDNPFLYCSEYFDEETSTYYLRARHYNPANGRFTQEDPIGAGLNWYTYCSSNPVMYADSSGFVEVGLRTYAATYEGSTVDWDAESGTATVTWQGKTLKVKSSAENNRDGHIYVDDSIFVEAFGIGGKIVVYQDPVTQNISIRASFNYRGEFAYTSIPGSESNNAPMAYPILAHFVKEFLNIGVEL